MKPLSGRNLARPRKAGKTGRAKITKILKAAYRLHFRDRSTRQAVKQCLG